MMTPPDTTLAHQLQHALQVLIDAAQQPGADETTLAHASNELATLSPRFAELTPAERAALEPLFTTLLAQLENAIAQLSTARDDIADQLKVTHSRATALKAYGSR